MKFCPDPHNFGRRVQIYECDGTRVFSKPRTVFWEWLLFGSDSVLRGSLEQVISRNRLSHGSGQSSFADVIFGLDIKKLESNSGFVVGVNLRVASPGSFEKDFSSFGVILAYCYVFGIQDLHFENILLSEKRPQVVDAEVVFSKLLLPNETLLLPLKASTYPICGMSSVCGGSGVQLSPDHAVEVIVHFIQTLLILSQFSQEILAQLFKYQSTILQTPVRVILRDTRKYRDHLNEDFEVPLMREEQLQLERGDIPYFFKLVGRNELFYCTDKQWSISSVESIHEKFQETVNRAAVNPIELLDEKRIQITPVRFATLPRERELRSWRISCDSRKLR